MTIITCEYNADLRYVDISEEHRGIETMRTTHVQGTNMVQQQSGPTAIRRS